MRLLMRCLASPTSQNSPSETVWKFGIDPESGLRSGQEGSKKSRSADSWRQRRVLETPSAIFQTVSPKLFGNSQWIPNRGSESGQEGSKESRSAASWRHRRVLEMPSAIFQTVSEGEFSEVRMQYLA